jgi:hypothetical protein
MDKHQRFADLVADYLAIHGGKPVVISRTENPAEWEEWKAYYRHSKFGASLELMLERTSKTVPCLSPFDLDPEYRQSRLPLGDQRQVD